MQTKVRDLNLNRILLAATLSLILPSTIQTVKADDYSVTIQQAKSDLSAGLPNEALVKSKEAIQIAPDRWQAYAVAGKAYHAEGKYNDAIASFDKALELAPSQMQASLRKLRDKTFQAKDTELKASSDKTIKSLHYSAAIVDAKSFLQASRLSDALAKSQEAMTMDPMRWEAYSMAGQALQASGQCKTALESFAKALDRAPDPDKGEIRDRLEKCKGTCKVSVSN